MVKSLKPFLLNLPRNLLGLPRRIVLELKKFWSYLVFVVAVLCCRRHLKDDDEKYDEEDEEEEDEQKQDEDNDDEEDPPVHRRSFELVQEGRDQFRWKMDPNISLKENFELKRSVSTVSQLQKSELKRGASTVSQLQRVGLQRSASGIPPSLNRGMSQSRYGEFKSDSSPSPSRRPSFTGDSSIELNAGVLLRAPSGTPDVVTTSPRETQNSTASSWAQPSRFEPDDTGRAQETKLQPKKRKKKKAMKGELATIDARDEDEDAGDGDE